MKPADFLTHYLRRNVQEGLVAGAMNRETAIKYGEHGFGKRPDVLAFPQDVAEFAKKSATSFHVSEERWANPLLLDTSLRRHEIDALRTGWDLVLDIDAPNWAVSKITAWLMVKTLEEHGIKSISVKFSGNKGWHIGVPFEAFPKTVQHAGTQSGGGADAGTGAGGAVIETRLLFPEAPRLIAAYILAYITKKHIVIKDNRIVFGNRFSIDFEKLRHKLQRDDLAKTICMACGTEKKEKEKPRVEYGCEKCGEVQIKEEESLTTCQRCSKLMRRMGAEHGCSNCGNEEYARQVNLAALIEVDTVLISSRHLYRAPYSLHEKSGLASVPIMPEEILEFNKEQAQPKSVRRERDAGKPVFLERSAAAAEEGMRLLSNAIDFHYAQKRLREQADAETIKGKAAGEKEFEKFQTAAPEQLFPPCIRQMLAGMKDGKKRAMFVLINFLASVGWDADAIEKRLEEWNEKNAACGEPLRETVLRGRLRYHRQQKHTVLPPNCDNAAYYASMGMKCAEEVCRKCTNPVQYVRRMMWRMQHAGKGKEEKEKKKRVISDEQKQRMQNARRKCREFREVMKEKREQGKENGEN